MSDGVRRGHLVYAGGVGGLTILQDGTSVICAGLDYWFKHPDGRAAMSAIEANTITDWRLEGRLNVEQLRTPPAAPTAPWVAASTEAQLGVPFLRFPLWHVCPRCKRLRETKNLTSEPVRCLDCRRDKGLRNGPVMVQVPLVAACEAGHLEEFPWRRWLSACTCSVPDLRLSQKGGTGLSNYFLSCRNCRKSKSMGMALQDGAVGDCTGRRPWLYESDQPGCKATFKGTLRNSASLYFSNVTTSVYLPRGRSVTPAGLLTLLESPQVRSLLPFMQGLSDQEAAEAIFKYGPHLTGGFSTDEWAVAIGAQRTTLDTTSIATSETDYRFAEWTILSEETDDARLRVRKRERDDYGFRDGSWLQSIGLVEDLVVTKALTGFSRLMPARQDRNTIGTQMWKTIPGSKERWLPAVQVRGEGILIAFSEDAVSKWEQRESVRMRVQPLIVEAASSKHVDNESQAISARFILLHTFAHVLMNRLVFEAGYSATALSERIYSRVPSLGEGPMAAVLIYTASGDSEGSLGGLVRLGEPGHLERLIHDAIEGARWCSSDPICMELGGTARQGPDGLNLAACHSCAHLPETACETFNVLLDRGLLIGSLSDPQIGFFN